MPVTLLKRDFNTLLDKELNWCKLQLIVYAQFLSVHLS